MDWERMAQSGHSCCTPGRSEPEHGGASVDARAGGGSGAGLRHNHVLVPLDGGAFLMGTDDAEGVS